MTDDANSLAVQKSNWTTIVTIASISGIFLVFIVALWVAGFFTFTGSDPSSKVVAAALALVGGLIAAVVSVVGILLKYSIDQRTEARLAIEAKRAAAERKIESERASALQTQAEQRLKLEAAIRSVELFGASEGNAAALQRAGALFTLSSLDQHELTLRLTAELLQRGELEPTTACDLIERALSKGDASIQQDAIDVLYDHAERMITPLSTSVPDSLITWDPRLTGYVREWGFLALSKILIARAVPIWQNQFRGELLAIVGGLGVAWLTESAQANNRLADNIGAALNSVLKAFPEMGTIVLLNREIDTAELREKVSSATPNTTSTIEAVRLLDTWSEAKELTAVAAQALPPTKANKPEKTGIQFLFLSLSKES